MPAGATEGRGQAVDTVVQLCHFVPRRGMQAAVQPSSRSAVALHGQHGCRFSEQLAGTCRARLCAVHTSMQHSAAELPGWSPPQAPLVCRWTLSW